MGNVFKSQLEIIQKNLEKKTKKRGISQYLDDNDDDDNSEFSDDEFDNSDSKNMTGEKDPGKLIDLELVNLLKFCNDLKLKHKESDAHQEAVMMNSLELGKKTKEKLLILDMDECMIAAKFEGKQQKNFQPNFSFDFQGTQIHVRLRPYLSDALEKLSQLYEIVVWTAGV
jgi:TFIIF-interacting CTD phosphatase-like protein